MTSFPTSCSTLFDASLSFHDSFETLLSSQSWHVSSTDGSSADSIMSSSMDDITRQESNSLDTPDFIINRMFESLVDLDLDPEHGILSPNVDIKALLPPPIDYFRMPGDTLCIFTDQMTTNKRKKRPLDIHMKLSKRHKLSSLASQHDKSSQDELSDEPSLTMKSAAESDQSTKTVTLTDMVDDILSKLGIVLPEARSEKKKKIKVKKLMDVAHVANFVLSEESLEFIQTQES